ncbi:hypothetical protein [Legionella fallonii]|uniref:Uncharacterized protein n=1 Tax=Legionella fallonii LLAP-10 TaxID=1212491 RepID=A0A098G719_9GAMM|nr:hypothetical protein [Legionella fallonii]CEG57774.1 protein of unknown function [Legionella fallonii LLAP-10]
MKRKHDNLDNSKKFKRSKNLVSKTSAPLTKPRSDLTFFKGVFVKNHDKEKRYYFKVKTIERAQFESYCAAIHRFIVTEKYVPSYKAYEGSMDPFDEWFESIISMLDDMPTDPLQLFSHLIEHCSLPLPPPDEQMHGVASKAIDFKSNFEDPLREEDLVMKCQPFFNGFMMARINKLLTQKIDKLEEFLKNLHFSQRIKNFFSQTTAHYQVEFYKNILTSLDRADTQMMQNWLNNPLCPKKLKPLLTSWIEQNTTGDNTELSIPIFEQLDIQYPTPVLDKTLNFSFKGKDYSISSELLNQYRLIKGLGRTLIMRSVFNDWDNNNSNFSKRGQMIDFEYSKMNVLMSGPFWHPYQKLFDKIVKDKKLTINESGIEQVLDSESYQEAFKFLGFDRRKWSPDLISHFPDMGDNEPYVHYHPTKRLYFNRVLFGLVTSLLIKCRDNHDHDIVQFISGFITELFSPQDIQSTPNFINTLIDRCYIGFLVLKGVLAGESLTDVLKREQNRALFTKLSNKWDDFYHQHQALFEYAEMFLLEKFGSKTKVFSPEDNVVYQLLPHHPVFIYHKNVSLLKYILTTGEHYRAMTELYLDNDITKTQLVEDEKQSLKDLKSILIHTKQFQQFITNHGEEAMEIILREFAETKIKYQNKLDEKPHFINFVDRLDLTGIKQDYLEIKEIICLLNSQSDSTPTKGAF